MSGNDSSATATLTASSASASVAADDEEEDPALTSDCESADMDLVNGPNPWLPAYGFQLQHHSHFQPTHLEDLRANGSYPIPPSISLPYLFYFLFLARLYTCALGGRSADVQTLASNVSTFAPTCQTEAAGA